MVTRNLGEVVAFILLCGATVFPAQDSANSICTCKPRQVGASGSRVDWEGYGKGVRWHYSVDEAMKIAKDQNRLVFWYHVVGDLDKEGC